MKLLGIELEERISMMWMYFEDDQALPEDDPIGGGSDPA